MNLFEGLEKFGFSGKKEFDITKDDKDKEKEKKKLAEKEAAKKQEPDEKSYILDRSEKCPVCDKEFTTKQVKSGKVRRKGQDEDLRPRSIGVDTLKYDVTVCPYCGYASLNKSFEPVSVTQIRLLKEQVASKFKPGEIKNSEIYTYDEAMERYKLALVSAMVKRAKTSEKSYICLKMAWMLRDIVKAMPSETPEQKKLKSKKNEEYLGYYNQAFEGFLKAISEEMPPYFGLQTSTLEFILVNMAVFFKKYDIASKLLSNLLGSPSTPPRLKDKAIDLKQEIVDAIKNQKN